MKSKEEIVDCEEKEEFGEGSTLDPEEFRHHLLMNLMPSDKRMWRRHYSSMDSSVTKNARVESRKVHPLPSLT